MKYVYFIINDALTSKIGDLTPGEKIIAIPTIKHFFYLNEKGGESPFFSLEILKQNSSIYARLKKKNPRRAHKIIQP